MKANPSQLFFNNPQVLEVDGEVLVPTGDVDPLNPYRAKAELINDHTFGNPLGKIAVDAGLTPERDQALKAMRDVAERSRARGSLFPDGVSSQTAIRRAYIR